MDDNRLKEILSALYNNSKATLTVVECAEYIKVNKVKYNGGMNYGKSVDK